MKICVFMTIVMAVCLVACKHDKNAIVRIDNPEHILVTDSIYSRLPGSMFYQDGIIYWQDALSAENFIHAIEVSTGKELYSFGNMGDGPEEFAFPLFSLSSTSGLYISDLKKNLEILYQIDKDSDTLNVSIGTYENKTEAKRIIHLGDDEILYFFPNKEKPFEIYRNGACVSSGNLPLDEHVTNGNDVYQGSVVYNPKNAYLVYSTFGFPYMAVYHWENNKPVLKKELKTPVEYTILEKELKLDNKDAEGTMELALTANYIVALQRDKVVEGEMPKAKYARDMSTLPRSLFVYDYDLNLIKIINMPFPLLRLCGDFDSDDCYIIGANPEFEILKINLAD